MPLDEGVKDSVTNSNFKNVADAPGWSQALAMQNAVAHQNRVNLIAEAAVGNIVRRLSELTIADAKAQEMVATGDLANKIAEVGAAVASLQASIKGGQTTPPETGQGA